MSHPSANDNADDKGEEDGLYCEHCSTTHSGRSHGSDRGFRTEQRTSLTCGHTAVYTDVGVFCSSWQLVPECRARTEGASACRTCIKEGNTLAERFCAYCCKRHWGAVKRTLRNCKHVAWGLCAGLAYPGGCTMCRRAREAADCVRHVSLAKARLLETLDAFITQLATARDLCHAYRDPADELKINANPSAVVHGYLDLLAKSDTLRRSTLVSDNSASSSGADLRLIVSEAVQWCNVELPITPWKLQDGGPFLPYGLPRWLDRDDDETFDSEGQLLLQIGRFQPVSKPDLVLTADGKRVAFGPDGRISTMYNLHHNNDLQTAAAYYARLFFAQYGQAQVCVRWLLCNELRLDAKTGLGLAEIVEQYLWSWKPVRVT